MSDFRADDADGLTEEGMVEMVHFLRNLDHTKPVTKADAFMCHLLAIEIERLREREARLFTHEGADAFWKVWNEIGEPHIHGVYESTWAAFRRALEADDE